MEGCTTRQAAVGDASKLTMFMREVAEEASYLLLPPQAFNKSVANHFEHNLFTGQIVGVVAQNEENSMIGNCLITAGEIEANRHVGYIAVAVRKDLRGRGLGRRLVEEAMKVSDCEVFIAECFAENRPSIDLFASLGFIKVGEIPNYIYKNNQFHNKVILSK